MEKYLISTIKKQRRVKVESVYICTEVRYLFQNEPWVEF